MITEDEVEAKIDSQKQLITFIDTASQSANGAASGADQNSGATSAEEEKE